MMWSDIEDELEKPDCISFHIQFIKNKLDHVYKMKHNKLYKTIVNALHSKNTKKMCYYSLCNSTKGKCFARTKVLEEKHEFHDLSEYIRIMTDKDTDLFEIKDELGLQDIIQKIAINQDKLFVSNGYVFNPDDGYIFAKIRNIDSNNIIYIPVTQNDVIPEYKFQYMTKSEIQNRIKDIQKLYENFE